MKKKIDNRKGGFAFLGKSLRTFVLITSILLIMVIAENELRYMYNVVQKDVQDGNVSENWERYLILALITAVISCLATIFKVFVDMWTQRTTKLNFYERYQFIIQNQKEACMLQYNKSLAKISALTGIIMTTINSYYSIKLMGIVSMTLPQYLGAIVIVCCGISLGVWRGRLQKESDAIHAKVTTKEQILMANFMISTKVLRNHLHEIKRDYSERTGKQIIKNTLSELPKLIRVVVFIMLMYGILKSMNENVVYSYSYVVWSAYGSLLELALLIGYVVEDLSKIKAYKKDKKLSILNSFEENEYKIVEQQRKNITMSEEEFEICQDFTANVTKRDGCEAYYSVCSKLVIKRGEIVMLEGENGTGKSRLLKLLKVIFKERCSAYDVNTGIMPDFVLNFMDSKSLDSELIKRLAEGLGIERVPKDSKEFCNMELHNINGADQQLLIALQILYFVKRTKGPKLIILDEILSNVSESNSENVMKYISNVLKSEDVFVIVVSHCYKDVVRKYVKAIWTMVPSEDKIRIEEIKK